MSRKVAFAISFLTLLAWAGAMLAQSNASPDAVVRWNRIATEAAAAAQTDPLTESRLFSILHIAIHDAVNAIDRRYESYRFKASTAPGASLDAAIAAAAHAVLIELLPAAKSTFDAAHEEALRSIPNEAAKKAGIEIGQDAAEVILSARKIDGSSKTAVREAGKKPGEYRPTPPDFTPAWSVHWASVTPFVMKSPAQFRPQAPPKVNSAQALADIEEVKALGAEKSTVRTNEQSEIARFWYENSPRGWNRIAREVSAARQLNVHDNARLFALVNMAMADGYIGVFEAKYYYNYWRPATAIRAAGDPEWLNYLPTPPIPDYPSGHTVLGAGVAAVLEKFCGTDFVSFSITSGAPYPGITRKFWSFSEAARENGASRVFAGIHFTTAVNTGYLQGTQIGTWTFENALRPLKAQPTTPVSIGSIEPSR